MASTLAVWTCNVMNSAPCSKAQASAAAISSVPTPLPRESGRTAMSTSADTASRSIRGFQLHLVQPYDLAATVGDQDDAVLARRQPAAVQLLERLPLRLTLEAGVEAEMVLGAGHVDVRERAGIFQSRCSDSHSGAR